MKPSQVHAIPPEHLEEPMQVVEHIVEPMDVVANECSTLLALSFIVAFKNNFYKRSQTRPLRHSNKIARIFSTAIIA